MAYADSQSRALYAAVKAWGETQKIASPPTEVAQQHFWHSLDLQRQKLLGLVKDDAPLSDKDLGQGNDPWTQAVHQAGRDAYQHACARTTPRQLEAYAKGLRLLRPKTSQPKSPKKPAITSP